ncbi:ABC transporter ATP-binding protein [Flavobacteriaceae bacterium M23B6Z8]
MIILKAENISKQYRLGVVGTGTLSHDVNRWWHLIRGKEDPYLKIGEANNREESGSSEYVWALRDINFEVQQGEVLGIIGKNGAGKSTLLKILSKVTNPTTGSIKSRGRIASLLEVGTGFHPELTGRENVFLNGAILGMTKAEINSKIDEIVSFSGCERYIDTPVKRYSSGMKVRLAFAVAAHLEPEILVVDEVLAVGDAEFQKKAIGKMQDISRGDGRTVLFVSHNMTAVANLCKRGILLDKGTVIMNDEIDKVIEGYLSMDSEISHEYDLSELKRSSGLFPVLQRLEFLTPEQEMTFGNDLSFRVFVDVSRLSNITLGYLIRDEKGMSIMASNTHQYLKKIKVQKSKGYIDVVLKKIPLGPGKYRMSLYLGDGTYDLDILEGAISFYIHWNKDIGISPPQKKWGPVFTLTEWNY